MKQIPTKEQVLDALQTHKTIYRAAMVFGVTAPTFKQWMKRYGIVANHNVKQKPVNTGRDDDEHAFRCAINRWYK